MAASPVTPARNSKFLPGNRTLLSRVRSRTHSFWKYGVASIACLNGSNNFSMAFCWFIEMKTLTNFDVTGSPRNAWGDEKHEIRYASYRAIRTNRAVLPVPIPPVRIAVVMPPRAASMNASFFAGHRKSRANGPAWYGLSIHSSGGMMRRSSTAPLVACSPRENIPTAASNGSASIRCSRTWKVPARPSTCPGSPASRISSDSFMSIVPG